MIVGITSIVWGTLYQFINVVEIKDDDYKIIEHVSTHIDNLISSYAQLKNEYPDIYICILNEKNLEQEISQTLDIPIATLNIKEK